MANNQIQTVTFAEGAPLDPNDLNTLQTNITNTFATSNLLYNATQGAQGSVVPIVYANSIKFNSTSWTAGQVRKSGPIAFPSSFDTSKSITIVASIAQGLEKDKNFTVSAYVENGLGVVEVMSEAAYTSTVTINYIAIQLKAVA
jgi:hypothetical protein